MTFLSRGQFSITQRHRQSTVTCDASVQMNEAENAQVKGVPMIVVVVRAGGVKAVYSDEQYEDVKVLDFDRAEDPGAEAPPEQLRTEIRMIERDMHRVI